MSKKILIINGNPKANSFCSGLADAYKSGAEQSGAEVQQINLGMLDFDVNLPNGYDNLPSLEPDLEQALKKIMWSEHQVWIHPIWWFSLPGIMKGFIDRVFLPGIAFKYVKGPIPKKLFAGRTARIVATADTPKFYYDWFIGAPATKQLKQGTLQFCGISPVRTTYLGPLRNSSDLLRERWLRKVEQLGEALS